MLVHCNFFFFSALLLKYKIIVCFSLLNGKYRLLLLTLYHGELEMPQCKAFFFSVSEDI